MQGGWVHTPSCVLHNISMVFVFGPLRGAHGAGTMAEAKEKNLCSCKQNNSKFIP